MADSNVPVTKVVELIVGQRDNEAVTRCSIDKEKFEKERRKVVFCIGLPLFPILLFPLFIPLYVFYLCIVLWQYSQYQKIYITDNTLHVNPDSPKGLDVVAIPLEHSATVETQGSPKGLDVVAIPLEHIATVETRTQGSPKGLDVVAIPLEHTATIETRTQGSPKGMDVVAIPLEHIATVETRTQGRIFGCCCQLPGDNVVIKIKEAAPPVVVNVEDSDGNQGTKSTRSYQIKLVNDVDYVAQLIRQKIYF